MWAEEEEKICSVARQVSATWASTSDNCNNGSQTAACLSGAGIVSLKRHCAVINLTGRLTSLVCQGPSGLHTMKLTCSRLGRRRGSERALFGSCQAKRVVKELVRSRRDLVCQRSEAKDGDGLAGRGSCTRQTSSVVMGSLEVAAT